MKVCKKEVEKIAKLANLHLLEEEKEKLQGHLNQILAYVEKSNELDTEDVEPTSHVQHSGDVMREDRVMESLPRSEAIQSYLRQDRP